MENSKEPLANPQSPEVHQAPEKPDATEAAKWSQAGAGFLIGEPPNESYIQEYTFIDIPQLF